MKPEGSLLCLQVYKMLNKIWYADDKSDVPL